ncbi:MAG: PQQ-dependent sugar dehydrogenase [Prosthecobacter sp.]|uniref:PQQ-dependent sugar dehydrogenase n=1 Tax=Prosthecobacter sp. TaxID=1965333 RepID=UPI0039033756
MKAAPILCLAFLSMTIECLYAQLVRQPNTTLNLPATLPAATGYTTTNAIPFAGGGGMTFTNPMCTAFPNGETNRLYVALRAGVVRVVNNLSAATPSQAIFMDLASYLTSIGQALPFADENGLLSMVFHPDYNDNGFFYLYFSITLSGQLHQRLARFQATGTPGSYNAATSADPATMTPLLTIYDQAINHNGGDLAFGADGYLYLSLGDEGGGGDFYNNARFINKDFWGQMIRIDVDNRAENLPPNAHTQPASTSHPSAVHAGTYKVPADNPFIGFTSWHGQTIVPATVRTEIFATGFRNPFRFTIDPPTGRIFLGDVGQLNWEEVDIVVKGGDYGWSWREGLHEFYQSATVPPRFPDNFGGNTNAPPVSGFTPIDPIFEYVSDNSAGGTIYGTSVCGGIVYRGNQLTELQGKYIFGDVYGGGGIIAALTETSPGVWTAQQITTRPQIVDFGVDPRNGEPLLCGLGGTIYKLTRSGTTGTEPPATLSATGAFSNLSTLTPNAGIVAYDPNVNFWSDYAIKSRWFSIPNTTATITFSAMSNWTFPTGTVWIKHFDFETTRGVPATRRKLETRFLVKTATDVYGLSYKWRADQSDADLVAEAGLTEVISSSLPSQTWRYPSRGECVTCHTPVGGHALSFNTPQLNRGRDYGAGWQNQLQALNDAGYFSAAVTGVNNLAAFAAANDTSQSLEWRVRSYLAVNCVQCHQPGGAAQGSWDARSTIKTDAANLINGLLVNNDGDAANRFIVPGDAAHSMLLRRQQGNGITRMPPLGTFERDLVNEQLVSDWIAALSTRQSFTQWQSSQNPPVGGANDDPDHDGRSNLLEFLTGTNPHASSSGWSYGVMQSGGVVAQFQFTHPANRAAIIEVSSDLVTWRTWDAPGNLPFYPATDATRTITAPLGSPDRFFRVRFEEL